MDCSPPGSSVHGMLQTRIMEWVAMPSSRGSSWPGDWTRISCVSWVGRWVLYQCSAPAWKIPWTEKPGRLQSMGSQRVGHDFTFTFTFSLSLPLSCLGSRLGGRGCVSVLLRKSPGVVAVAPFGCDIQLVSRWAVGCSPGDAHCFFYHDEIRLGFGLLVNACLPTWEHDWEQGIWGILSISDSSSFAHP